MTDQFSIENMKAELARALNKADEDAKTIAELQAAIQYATDYLSGELNSIGHGSKAHMELLSVLTNNKSNIDFPILLQKEAE